MRSSFALLLSIVLTCVLTKPVAGVQEFDNSFREFDLEMVPTPTELYRALVVFQSGNAEARRIYEAKLKKLEESGREFFSNLTREQQKQALEFAEKFLKDNGVDSAQSRALMKQFGIPPDLQEALVERYKDSGPTGDHPDASLSRLLEQARQQARSVTRDSSRESNGPAVNWENKFRELSEQARQSVLDDPGNVARAQKIDSSFQDLLSRTRDTLSRSVHDSSMPKERLTARFDRLLIAAAKRTSLTKLDGSSDTDISDSVDTVFDNVIDRVHDSVLKKSGTPGSRSASGNGFNSSAKTSFPLSSVFSSESSDSQQSGDAAHPSTNPETAASIGRWTDVLKNLPGFPTGTTMILAAFSGLVLVALFIYLAFRTVTGDETAHGSRRFGRKFRKAKIRSPKDLVEAVDYFLVSKFGPESKWWNAKHARDVLTADAPEHRAKISDLIKDYIRARYMRTEHLIPESEQQRYRKTLQELSKLSNEPVLATARPPTTAGSDNRLNRP